MAPDETESGGVYTIKQQWGTGSYTSDKPYELDLYFKYMIGDRNYKCSMHP